MVRAAYREVQRALENPPKQFVNMSSPYTQKGHVDFIKLVMVIENEVFKIFCFQLTQNYYMGKKVSFLFGQTNRFGENVELFYLAEYETNKYIINPIVCFKM